MFTEITTTEELKQLISEGFFLKTDKITKISDDSVLNGLLYSNAKIGQKALKEIALVETYIYPDLAKGEKLDKIASDVGISKRFNASKSSTYIRLVGNPGTFYDSNIITFSSTDGINFELESSISIPDAGFIYAKVRSKETGEKTNSAPLSITKISPIPNGHLYCINEYQASNGRDIESDFSLLQRIKTGPNKLAKNTLEYIKQVLLNVDTDILRVIYQGRNAQGKNVLKLLSQNGVAYNNSQLRNFEQYVSDYLGISDLKRYDNSVIGITFENAAIYPIDISARVELYNGVDADEVRIEAQIRSSKILDLRTWSNDKIIDWEDFLIAIKTIEKVKSVKDQYFTPKTDIKIPKNTFPRIRGFLLLDMDGNILSDSNNALNSIYYPTELDFNFQYTIMGRNT